MASTEKDTLRRFVVQVLDFLAHTSDGSGELFTEFKDAIRSSRAPLAGFREAANDIVEMAQDVDGDDLAALDAHLESHDLPTLSAMRDTRYRKLLRIIATGKIASESQHRLVVEALGNLDNGSLSDDERA